MKVVGSGDLERISKSNIPYYIIIVEKLKRQRFYDSKEQHFYLNLN